MSFVAYRHKYSFLLNNLSFIDELALLYPSFTYWQIWSCTPSASILNEKKWKNKFSIPMGIRARIDPQYPTLDIKGH